MPDVYSADKSPESKSHSKKKRDVNEYSEILKAERPTDNHFRSFLPKPPKTTFDAQTREEKIVLLLRQHPVSLLKTHLIIIAALLLPLFSGQSFFPSFLPSNYLLAINLGWYMLTFSFAVASFLMWFFSVYIITDERIIDVDFVSLLYKNVASAKIDSVQDVSSKTSGFMASVFNYGTVYIQTAGEQREIEFDNIPQPAKVAALLNELLLEEEREKIEGRVS